MGRNIHPCTHNNPVSTYHLCANTDFTLQDGSFTYIVLQCTRKSSECAYSFDANVAKCT